ncbi:MAG TPA: 4Fe-4S dicluster domain-containing protein [Thermoleophilia bacterium]|nr:4Fe-4S dicluster domain-containing protein [Thermoleophilia bacterium]
MAVSEALRREVAALAADYRTCYQCGQCTAVCPSGADLEHGPRRVLRLILTQQAERLLACDDVWRCTGCGSCSTVCPMELDVAAAMTRLRAVAREGAGRCPERQAAAVATKRLSGHDTIDSMAFGVAMAAHGYVPSDVVGAAGAASRLVRARLRLPGSLASRAPGKGVSADPASDSAGAVSGSPDAASTAAATGRPFYPGCALRQDQETFALTRAVARGLDLELAEAAGAACCGHPSREAAPSGYSSAERVVTTCPACDQSLAASGTETTPLWELLVEHAQRRGRRLRAAAPAFVPYVGCLAERETALASLAGAATLAGAECLTSFPSLHSGCCGALGGMYRSETKATRRLLDHAATRSAPVVTTCLLCRDNLRSAARRRGLPVTIHFWPEFFSAAGPADTSEGDRHD